MLHRERLEHIGPTLPLVWFPEGKCWLDVGNIVAFYPESRLVVTNVACFPSPDLDRAYVPPLVNWVELSEEGAARLHRVLRGLTEPPQPYQYSVRVALEEDKG